MRICIATGTRAEYGLLKPLMTAVKNEPGLELKVLVTGAHLSPEFGLTYKQIQEDGFELDATVEMLLSSDSSEGIVKSMGLGMIGFSDAFKNLQPDMIVILGDRYEMLSLASAALIFKIPIIHLHGGETTEGAYDDAIRHAITKMSHLHFASTEAYRTRIIQMGEQPDRVFNVGAIGLDNLRNYTLLSRSEIESDLNLKFNTFNYLIAFHPETLSEIPVETQFKNLLHALDQQSDSLFIFTLANADTSGRVINDMMRDYVASHTSSAVLFPSLGSLRFLSVMKQVDAIIGNSSSGIIEAPSVKTATINIGDRQKGRIQARSVINCMCDTDSILEAFATLKTPAFTDALLETENPYDSGGTVSQIMQNIRNINLESLRTKVFYD